MTSRKVHESLNWCMMWANGRGAFSDVGLGPGLGHACTHKLETV